MKCIICKENSKRESSFCSRRCYNRKKNSAKYFKGESNLNYNGKQCLICNKDVVGRKNKSFCSDKCYGIFWRKNNPTYSIKHGKIYNGPYYIENKEGIQKRLLKNRNKIYEYARNRYKNNLNFRMSMIARNSIWSKLRNPKIKKCEKSEKLLGCSTADFIKHIEKQFLPEMSWGNYAIDWEIDHIKMKSLFDMTKIKEQKEFFHYNNQRPLWKTTEIANIYGYDMIGNRNREKIMIKEIEVV